MVSSCSPQPRRVAGLKLPGAGSFSLMTLCPLLAAFSELSFPTCTGRMWVVQSFWRATYQALTGAHKTAHSLWPCDSICRSLS